MLGNRAAPETYGKSPQATVFLRSVSHYERKPPKTLTAAAYRFSVSPLTDALRNALTWKNDTRRGPCSVVLGGCQHPSWSVSERSPLCFWRSQPWRAREAAMPPALPT